MIQRKQTLFLLLAIVSLALMFALPLARYGEESGPTTWTFTVFGLYGVDGAVAGVGLQIPFPAVLGILIVLMGASIAMYRNRQRQLRFTRMSFLLTLGLIVALVVTNNSISSYLGQGRHLATALDAGFFLPLPALLFCWLASRGIRKDEEMVRAADRLR